MTESLQILYMGCCCSAAPMLRTNRVAVVCWTQDVEDATEYDKMNMACAVLVKLVFRECIRRNGECSLAIRVTPALTTWDAIDVLRYANFEGTGSEYLGANGDGRYFLFKIRDSFRRNSFSVKCDDLVGWYNSLVVPPIFGSIQLYKRTFESPYLKVRMRP